MSGISTAGKVNPVTSEKDWQIAKALESIARQIEWHFLNGTYAIATTAASPNQTRGMLQAATSGSTTAAASAALSTSLLDGLFLKMFTAGAMFKNPVIICNGFQKQQLSKLYGYAPEDRNVGGTDIKQILTDFGNIGVLPAHRLMPAGSLLVADLSVISVVTQPVPGKGNMFYEELSRTGAAERGEIFGQIGLDHGPCFAHGTLTGLATS